MVEYSLYSGLVVSMIEYSLYIGLVLSIVDCTFSVVLSTHRSSNLSIVNGSPFSLVQWVTPLQPTMFHNSDQLCDLYCWCRDGGKPAALRLNCNCRGGDFFISPSFLQTTTSLIFTTSTLLQTNLPSTKHPVAVVLFLPGFEEVGATTSCWTPSTRSWTPVQGAGHPVQGAGHPCKEPDTYFHSKYLHHHMHVTKIKQKGCLWLTVTLV